MLKIHGDSSFSGIFPRNADKSAADVEAGGLIASDLGELDGEVLRPRSYFQKRASGRGFGRNTMRQDFKFPGRLARQSGILPASSAFHAHPL